MPNAQLTNPAGAGYYDAVVDGGLTLDFEIDPFNKAMLLAGTDEIGYVLGHLPAIEAWEGAHRARVDTRIGTALQD